MVYLPLLAAGITSGAIALDNREQVLQLQESGLVRAYDLPNGETARVHHQPLKLPVGRPRAPKISQDPMRRWSISTDKFIDESIVHKTSTGPLHQTRWQYAWLQARHIKYRATR